MQFDQATSVYQIKEIWYWGDQFMRQFLTAIKKIIYNSDDTNKFKVDETEDGQKNEKFFQGRSIQDN